jgi:branched-chain amino acid aminotransferase
MDPRVNQGPSTLIILAEHKPPVYDEDVAGKGGLRLITSGIRRIPPDCLDQNIHSCNMLNSILAKIQANAAGVDDAIMLDVRGFVAETNATHLFIVEDGMVMTSHAHSCPEGITRSTVLGLCETHRMPCVVKDISIAEVYRADEIFCTGTMGELAPVTEVDGRIVGNGQRGKLTEKLSALYKGLTVTTGVEIVPVPV